MNEHYNLERQSLATNTNDTIRVNVIWCCKKLLDTCTRGGNNLNLMIEGQQVKTDVGGLFELLQL